MTLPTLTEMYIAACEDREIFQKKIKELEAKLKENPDNEVAARHMSIYLKELQRVSRNIQQFFFR